MSEGFKFDFDQVVYLVVNGGITHQTINGMLKENGKSYYISRAMGESKLYAEPNVFTNLEEAKKFAIEGKNQELSIINKQIEEIQNASFDDIELLPVELPPKKEVTE